MVTYPTAIHLCSGYGGFELALRPWNVRTVCHVERDAYATAILMERMEQKRLDQAPIWDDIDTFDGEPWCGKVDLITAGFPCQPFSAAGAHRGLDDDRWLWPSIARIIAEIRPRFVVLENVPPVIRHGLPAVLADLAQLGFDAEWGLYSAADVGAPHRRQRWWCVAYANSVRFVDTGEHIAGSEGTPVASRRPERFAQNLIGIVGERSVMADSGSERHTTITASSIGSETADGWQPDRDHLVERDVKTVAYTSSIRRKNDRADTERPALGDVARSSSDVADTNSGDSAPWDGSRENQRSRRRTNIQSGSNGIFPPTRDDTAAWSRWIAEGRPEPVVCRLADGPPSGLADALHLGGNGLVPQTATEAIRQLLNWGGWQL